MNPHTDPLLALVATVGSIALLAVLVLRGVTRALIALGRAHPDATIAETSKALSEPIRALGRAVADVVRAAAELLRRR